MLESFMEQPIKAYEAQHLVQCHYMCSPKIPLDQKLLKRARVLVALAVEEVCEAAKVPTNDIPKEDIIKASRQLRRDGFNIVFPTKNLDCMILEFRDVPEPSEYNT